MGQHILITGGAGFIGSHLADELLRHGHRVRALDNLSVQVHGPDATRPAYLDDEVELHIGDVRDRRAVDAALDDIDAVYHFAAAVGVGQSMYEIVHYTDVNNVGTSVLLEALAARPVERLIVASSMSLYGEGLYRAADGTTIDNAQRSHAQLIAHDWEPYDRTGETLVPIPTPETKTPALSSVYALSKFDQERLCLMLGRVHDIPTVALRFFNVFGTRQALSNPYTGVLAIFASRLLNGRAPMIFEDGLQLRDFVSVHDVARACRLALDAPAATGQAINIGSGRRFTVRDIAALMADALGVPQLTPEITGTYRVGDIRHCVADIALARTALGFEPLTQLEHGLDALVQWLEGQTAHDRVDEASALLLRHGLAV